jgi:hypothetical protein
LPRSFAYFALPIFALFIDFLPQGLELVASMIKLMIKFNGPSASLSPMVIWYEPQLAVVVAVDGDRMTAQF